MIMLQVHSPKQSRESLREDHPEERLVDTGSSLDSQGFCDVHRCNEIQVGSHDIRYRVNRVLKARNHIDTDLREEFCFQVLEEIEILEASRDIVVLFPPDGVGKTTQHHQLLRVLRGETFLESKEAANKHYTNII